MEQFAHVFSHITLEDALGMTLRSAIIILITATVAHFLTKLITRIFKNDGNPVTETSLFINTGRVVVWGVGIYVLLKAVFNIDASAIITALGVGGIAISLGMQDTLSNLIGGVQVTLLGLIKPGDNVEINGQTGVVQDVGWRHTTISNPAGETITVPNSILSKNALVQLPPAQRVRIPFAISDDGGMGVDEIVSEISKRAQAAALAVCEIEGDPDVKFTEITEYGFKGRVFITMAEANPANSLAIIDGVIRSIASLTRGHHE